MNNDLVPQHVLDITVSVVRFQVTSICLIHIEPVILDVLDACVETQRADGRAAAEVAVDALDQEVLGRRLDSNALITIADLDIMDPDVLS